MSDLERPRETGREADEDEAVRLLLRGAGPRTPVDGGNLAAIQEAARHEWRSRYAGRAIRRRRVLGLLAAATTAAAAAALSAVGLLWWLGGRTSRHPDVESVASVARLGGVVQLSEGALGSDRLASAADRRLPAGSRLRVEAAGYLSIRMKGGASVRLDAGTRARIASATLVELLDGSVYVDTAGGQGVGVRTSAGLFTPAGTQFEVRLDAGETRLRVREGNVALVGASRTAQASAGEELRVRPDGGLERSRAARHGPEWGWTLRAAPSIGIEGITLGAFLDWVSRETGWRIGLDDPSLAPLLESTVLHGSIEGLTPAEAPAVVLPGCGLTHRVSEGTLVVGSPGLKTPR